MEYSVVNGPSRGFTLIELLVVVAIIALLISILLPSLSRARAQAKLSVCASNLRQIGTGVHLYAADYEGHIPCGPDSFSAGPGSPLTCEVATNRIWLGGERSLNTLGLLLERYLPQDRLAYCPADDTNNPVEELAKFRDRGDEDAHSSYSYRQLDQTDGKGRIENLGLNDAGLPAKALAFDVNCTVPPAPGMDFYHTNHNAEKVNVVYDDGHVTTFDNSEDTFTMRPQDFPNFYPRIDQTLINADYGLIGDPARAEANGYRP